MYMRSRIRLAHAASKLRGHIIRFLVASQLDNAVTLSPRGREGNGIIAITVSES